MKSIKYFFQSLIIFFLFLNYKILGRKIASNLSSFLFKIIGPFFRPKKLIEQNILKAFPKISQKDLNVIISNMWSNYGRILSEYVFLKDFRESKFENNLEIIGQDILEEIKKDKKPVIFISGHFNNFELMAMHIEKSGIDLATIYRPLNNKFLNLIMEKIRKKYICKNQIKKGINGVRESLKFFKQGTSIAIMIDQRVSEGEKINFFDHPALTTTIPAQFVKKFGCKIQPVHIERHNKINFKITFDEQIFIEENADETLISIKLNQWLEKKIRKNPSQWIWSHNRWK